MILEEKEMICKGESWIFGFLDVFLRVEEGFSWEVVFIGICVNLVFMWKLDI